MTTADFEPLDAYCKHSGAQWRWSHHTLIIYWTDRGQITTQYLFTGADRPRSLELALDWVQERQPPKLGRTLAAALSGIEDGVPANTTVHILILKQD